MLFIYVSEVYPTIVRHHAYGYFLSLILFSSLFVNKYESSLPDTKWFSANEPLGVLLLLGWFPL